MPIRTIVGRSPRHLWRTILVTCLLAGPAGAGGPTGSDLPPSLLVTNEAELGRLYGAPDVDASDIDAVFRLVFGALDDVVTVWPTENYYFVRFVLAGVEYAGNIRLDAGDRDSGIVHFAYFRRSGPDGTPGEALHKAFGAADDVKVTSAGRFAYVVAHDHDAVVFRLNDLSGVAPTTGQLGADEIHIGPILDESGIGFFLVWNPDLKLFLYLLDEARSPESFVESAFSSQIRVGRRTGFAIYRDRYRERWILVGVRRDEARRNTSFDGPFDQMPDNFIRGDTLRDALIARRPGLAGRIDRFGNLADLAGRAIIVPYLLYDDPSELTIFDECAARAATAADFYRCFDREPEG